MLSGCWLVAGYHSFCIGFAWGLNGFTTALYRAKAVQTPCKPASYGQEDPCHTNGGMLLPFVLTMKEEFSIPPGWEYNPSAYSQRYPIALLAFAGLCIALYLGLFQLHIIKQVWDPVFKKGSESVLESKLSQSFPIPDALLGASAYVLDIIFDLVGDSNRWKSKPWAVILFGLAAGPLGFMGIFLVISQGVIVHDWCTLCLCSALISVIIISPASDEVLATLQYLQRIKHNNYSVWKAFWGSKEIAGKVI